MYRQSVYVTNLGLYNFTTDYSRCRSQSIQILKKHIDHATNTWSKYDYLASCPHLKQALRWVIVFTSTILPPHIPHLPSIEGITFFGVRLCLDTFFAFVFFGLMSLFLRFVSFCNTTSMICVVFISFCSCSVLHQCVEYLMVPMCRQCCYFNQHD